MKGKLVSLVLTVLWAALSVGQDARPPATLRDAIPFGGAGSESAKSGPPSFCTGKSCLYYAGDFDWNNSGANGICDANNGTINCTAWVAVKPNHNVLVTGSSFVLLPYNLQLGSTNAPFQVRVGISPGQAGKLVCSTSGSGTLIADGGGGGPAFYALVVKQLKKPCPMKKGKIYFVSLQPQWSDGASWAFVLDEEDVPPLNHEGWKTVEDDSYSNDPSAGLNYAPVWGTSGVCSGLGCDAFSIALTGKNTK